MRYAFRHHALCAAHTAALSLFSCGATAQLAPIDPLAPAIAAVPQTARLIVVVPDTTRVLSALRTNAMLIRYASGTMAQTYGGWLKLAKSLDYSPMEAMTHLTSGGVAVVIVGEHASPDQHHDQAGASPLLPGGLALLTVVEAQVARHVAEKLQAKPRGLIEGHPVLSLDGGSIAMISRPLDPLLPEGRHLLIVAPGNEGDSTLRALLAVQRDSGPIPTMGQTELFKRAVDAKADVVVMARGDSPGDLTPADNAADPWATGALAVASFQSRRWMCHVQWPSSEASPARLSPLVSRAVEALDADGCSIVVATTGRPGDVLELVPAQILTLGGVLVGDLAPALRSAQMTPVQGSLLAVKPGKPGPEGEPTPSHIFAASTLPVQMAHAQTDSVGAEIVNAIQSSGIRPQRGQRAVVPGPSPIRASHLQRLDPAIPRSAPLQLAPGMAAMPVVGTRASVTWFSRSEAGSSELWRWGVWSIDPTDDPDSALAHAQRTADLIMPDAVAGQARVAESHPGRAYKLRAIIRPRPYAQSMAQGVGLALIGFDICDTARFDQWIEGGQAHAHVEMEWNATATEPAPASSTPGAPAKPVPELAQPR